MTEEEKREAVAGILCHFCRVVGDEKIKAPPLTISDEEYDAAIQALNGMFKVRS